MAWLACLGACLTLYAVATIVGRHGPRRSNLLVILGLGFCVFVSTIFIWAESLPRATSGLTLTRNLFFVLSILVLGAVTPVAIVLTALRKHWRWPRGAMRPPRPSVAPLLIVSVSPFLRPSTAAQGAPSIVEGRVNPFPPYPPFPRRRESLCSSISEPAVERGSG